MTGSLFFPLESLSFNTISTTKRLPESPGELFFPDLWSEAFFLFWCPSLPSTLRRKHIFAALPCCTFAGRTSPSSHPLSLNWLPIKDSILSDSARENGPWEASAFSYRISLSRAQQFKNPKNPSVVTVDQWTIPCFGSQDLECHLKTPRLFWDTRVQAPILICEPLWFGACTKGMQTRGA